MNGNEPVGVSPREAAAAMVTPLPAPISGGSRIPAGTLLAQNYAIQEVIGEGGMAVVYRGVQKSLNRPVAIKVLHRHFSEDPEFVTRFEREAGALAALNHPNVVSIIDRGNEGSHYFFVMELVDGETLDQKIIADTVKSQDWKDVVTACRDALEYVHKRGVVHLDIKASNILIDKEKRIKLSDFGIAHIVAGNAAGSIQGPGDGGDPKAWGTSIYMAPEQVASPGDVDARADVYALSVTFYKMMTRSLPHEPVAPPSEANNSIPLAVDAVLFRGMAPDRRDRHQSVREFCDDLLKALKDTSVSLASVLDYRSRDSAGALYSGADFITPLPVPSRTSSPAAPKPPAVAGTSALAAAIEARKAAEAPKEKESRKSAAPAASDDSNSKNRKTAPTKDAAAAPRRDPVKIALVGIGVTIVLLLVVAVAFMVKEMNKPKLPPGPLVPLERPAATTGGASQGGS